MKKTTLRLFALLLAAVLTVSAGCGQQESPSSPTAGSTPAASSAPGTDVPTTAEPTTAPAPETTPAPKAENTDPDPDTGIIALSLTKDLQAEKVQGKEPDREFKMNLLRFGSDLFRGVYAHDTENRTLLVSPLSAMLAMAMVTNGASGEALDELLNVLAGENGSLEDFNRYMYAYLSGLPSGEKAKFHIADSIWIRDLADFVVKDAFLKENVDYYQAEIFRAAFDDRTIRDINHWCDLHTFGMIPHIIQRIEPSDMLYLINALAFDADWASPYYKAVEEENYFTDLFGETQAAQVLYGEESYYLSDDICTGFMKDYAYGSYRFVALLPNEGIGIDEFVASLDAEKLFPLLNEPSTEKVLTSMPEFSFDYFTELNEVLKEMGIRTAFNRSAAGSFKEISNTDLFISGVVQKTFIEVSNMGTRAAAVTAVTAATTEMPDPGQPRTVDLNRPFVYMIIDTQTRLPLFIGTVTSLKK